MTAPGGRRTWLGTTLGVVALAASITGVVLIGQSAAGTSGPGTGVLPAAGLTGPGSSEIGYVPAGLAVNRSLGAESATIPDFTFLGGPSALITPRTDAGIRSAVSTGLIALADIRCFDEHEWNPSSDHSRGRGCDLSQDYRSAAGVTRGWQLANWLVANQAPLGINYVIWQNQTWAAWSPSSWRPYVSDVYGCPNPANITGCHMDHVHISFY